MERSVAVAVVTWPAEPALHEGSHALTSLGGKQNGARDEALTHRQQECGGRVNDHRSTTDARIVRLANTQANRPAGESMREGGE